MATERFNHTATLLPDGTVLVAGGDVNPVGVADTNSAELYQPATGTWVAGGMMNGARGEDTATLLTDGTVLVTGGRNNVSNVVDAVSSTELYVKVPAVIFGNLVQVYNGTAWQASYFTEPPGLTVDVTYDGSINAPTNAGSYRVVGIIADPDYPGGATNTLMVVKAQATVTLGQLVQTYNGTARSVSVTTTPPGLAVEVSYNGSTVAPTNAGSYTVIATVNDPNYQGSATGKLVITLAPTISAGPTNQVVAAGGTLTLSLTAGGFPPPAYQWFKDSRRLLGATNSTLTVTNADVTYSGTYYVAVTNAGGMAISPPVRVAVGNPALMAWGKNNYGQLGNGMASGSPNPNSGDSPNPTPLGVATNVVTGAAGEYHSLFVTADGTLLAMGWNPYGQLGNGTTTDAHTPVGVARNVVVVAAGRWHSLFVTADGTLWAMGYNYYGQLGNGGNHNSSYYGQTTPVSVASHVVAVAAGGYHSLFIKTDGTLWAMGFNGAGQLGNGDPTGANVLTPVFVASNIVMVAAGFVSSQFVKADGTLWTMGENYNGELGIGTSDSNSHPTPVRVANNVVAVASGGDQSLFVTADGTLWAMGDNWAGQLGNGDSTGANVLTPASVASHVVSVASGHSHSLFVKTDGTLWAMGYNVSGQLGIGTTISSTNLPVIVPHLHVANVFPADEAYHSLAVGKIQATVTLGNLNQTYTGSAINASVSTVPLGLAVELTYNASPVAPTNAGSYTVIGTISDPIYFGSATNILVISKATGTVILGNLVQTYDGVAKSISVTTAPPGLTVNLTYNGSSTAPANAGSYTVVGTINDPNYQGSATSTLVITLPPTITAGPTNQVVAAGGTLTLSLTAGGFPPPAYQWFKDSRRLLGATNSTLTVTNANVTCSGTYYVVVTNIGGMVISVPALVAVGNPSLLAWGINDDGQFGNGTNNYYADPTPVSVASNVVAGTAGGNHSLFVTTDGTLWATGWNVFGQLGNGDQTGTNVFTPAGVASNVVAVATGYGHSLFVMADGTLWAMGWNQYGQLGNGTTNNARQPIIVASNVVAVAAGAVHSLFLKTDGTLWGMGLNNFGQLGNGTISDYWVANPTPMSVASNVVAVAAGDSHSLFVKTDGTLWVMGANWYGELGNGDLTGTNVLTPAGVASNVVAVAAGGGHSLFVKTDGTLWAMGWNQYGQLGNGDSTGSNVHSPEFVASNVVAVAAGESHSLFVKANGTPWAMGDNGFGQLGNGTTSNTNLPVIVPHLFVANVFPANSAFHSLAIGIIQATVTLGNLTQTYTGGAINVTASTTPPGLTVNLTYNGSSDAPTNAGSYTVVGTINDPNYQGSATNTLVVRKATGTLTFDNLVQTYDGAAKNVSVSTAPPGLAVDVTYNGSTATPINAGSYTVVGTIDDQNYQGIATNTLTVGKAAGTVTLGNLIQTYDGAAKGVSFTTAPPGLTVKVTYNGSTDAPTNAGSYTVIGAIDEQDYFGSVTNTLVIGIRPVILDQPANCTNNLGTIATFNVLADGTHPLLYQWRKDGTNYSDVNSSILTLTNVQKSDEGLYSVTISNAYGVAISADARLTVNLPPVADATATIPLTIAVNGSNATVVLDGSRSSDPDGDSLQYTWFNTGSTNALTNGVVAVVILPVGTNSITLVVSDGLATNSQIITVEVITTAQAISHLIDAAGDASTKQSLLATLRAALASINRSNPTSAINQLQAFQNQVNAQLGSIDSVTAQALIDEAQAIIDAITGASVTPAKVKITSKSNGKSHLNFSGTPGQIYIIEASPDLANWEKIGVANGQTNGDFIFDDANSANIPARYYRVVVP
jgi:alpha-tubulin suppressor-like RCC1 family protein